jgi:Ni,Fe-hydrogenase III small subunit
MFETLKIFFHQGKQYIPDVTKAKVPGIFRGRPIISNEKVEIKALQEICPTNAISGNPVTIDLGKCVFCGACQKYFPNKIQFTQDFKIATNNRTNLLIKECIDSQIIFDKEETRPEIRKSFKHSLKLRQVSAGGDNSCEWELGATGNANFDMGRFGIEFVASPRHADGIVITGPITKNMAKALEICYDAVPSPKIIICAGTDAISGGIFADSPELDRTFIDKHKVDLYIPGNPTHPLTIINGLLDLTR